MECEVCRSLSDFAGDYTRSLNASRFCLGILRDVFSQRASAAWQAAPPQKVTVSILLPGRCTSDFWLDYLQSQRHFWPSMTTRFASMAPVKEMVFRKERQRLKSKHLWDTIDLDWDALYKKLYVHKPTGLSRDLLWRQLFWNKHRLNPWMEQEYQGSDWYDVRQAWKTAQWEIGRYQTTSIPFCMDIAATIQIFTDENEAAKQALVTVKERHAGRWQTKEGAYRIKQQLVLPDVRDAAGDIIMEDL